MTDPTQLSDQSIPERAVHKADAFKEPSAPKRVMSIHAHPDDQEFTVAGTLAKWARAGSAVISVIITSGDAGSNDKTPREMTKQELARIREEEQRNANRALGISETVFLNYPDGMLQATIDLRRDLTRLIRKFKPDAVVCGDPTMRFYGESYMNHPDHRVAGDVALDAVFPSAGTRFIFPELLAEGFEPHNVKKIFIHGSEKATTFVDISATIDTKIAALKEHKSQLGDWDPSEMMREWAHDEGKEHGLEAVEGFRVMILQEEEKQDNEPMAQ
ncbi:MAG: PIG-L family deacetylase [Chloroflexi bacterium]|nr:PIG-L family deacetylase [Chloroflexota bacterium]